MLPTRITAAALVLTVFATFCRAGQTNAPDAPPTPLIVTDVARGLENPWGLQFLADGRMLVTERPGRMRIVASDGTLSRPITGVPEVVRGGQAGLLDVLLSKDFSSSGLIYFSYSEPRASQKNATTVARAKLTLTGDGGALSDVTAIFRQEPAIRSFHHFGSRLVWAKDGTLFITTGERASERDSAQDLSTTLGKVIRLNAGGSVPKDNPFAGRDGARPEIWSFGHRNMQGAAINPATGELWISEHGARGGDELNIARAGKNYGWPVITWGIDYNGSSIGEGTTKAGMEQPVYYWKPSIGTSGLAFYTGSLFKQWEGNVLAGGLSGGRLERLVLDGERVIAVEHLLVNRDDWRQDGGRQDRIRDVRIGPDGAVYVLTDNANGKILKLTPAQ